MRRNSKIGLLWNSTQLVGRKRIRSALGRIKRGLLRLVAVPQAAKFTQHNAFTQTFSCCGSDPASRYPICQFVSFGTSLQCQIHAYVMMKAGRLKNWGEQDSYNTALCDLKRKSFSLIMQKYGKPGQFRRFPLSRLNQIPPCHVQNSRNLIL